MAELQYEAINESWIHHDEVLWKIPSYLSAINGGLILVAYRFTDHLLIRSLLLLIAAALSLSLLITVYKLYHFMIIEAETMKEIERDNGVKNRQFQTNPEPSLNYWFKRDASGMQAYSATKTQIYGMWVVAGILFILAGWNGYLWFVSS